MAELNASATSLHGPRPMFRWPQVAWTQCMPWLGSVALALALCQWAWGWTLAGDRFLSASDILLIGLLALTTLSDLREHKIFNRTTYPTIAWAALFSVGVSGLRLSGHTATWLGELGVAEFLVGSLGSGLLMLVPYSLARGGAGDVKLAVAMGAVLGLERTVCSLGCGYLLAAVWIVLSALPGGRWQVLWPGLARGAFSFLWPQHVASPTSGQRRELARPFPLAGCFAAGTLLVLFLYPVA
ncbi:MAG: prepilin peptidase [Planctomycetales bacterium]|nr:prepilin peptidase [Planctomycetales bacterium]